jgi:hypothetical protein
MFFKISEGPTVSLTEAVEEACHPSNCYLVCSGISHSMSYDACATHLRSNR